MANKNFAQKLQGVRTRTPAEAAAADYGRTPAAIKRYNEGEHYKRKPRMMKPRLMVGRGGY